jgi:hypothetical protein
VFENRVLRRIFVPKRVEVTEKWRKLHNEELNNWYFSPNILRVIKSRRMSSAGHVVRMGRKDVYTGFVNWNPEEKSPLRRPRLRWEDSIKIDF